MNRSFFRSPDEASSSSSSSEESETDFQQTCKKLFRSQSMPSGGANSKRSSLPTTAIVPFDNGIESSSMNSSNANMISTQEVLSSLALELFLKTLPDRHRSAITNVLNDILNAANVISPKLNNPRFQRLRNLLIQNMSGHWTNLIQKLPAFVDDAMLLEYSGRSNLGQLSLKLPSNFEMLSSRYESDFDEVKAIGMGGFGKVFHCKSRLDGQHYAIKKIPLKNSNPEAFQKMLDECRFHAIFQHPNVVRYHNAWVEMDSCPASPPVGSATIQRLSTTSARPLTSDVSFVDELKAPSVSDSLIQFQDSQNTNKLETKFHVTTPGTPTENSVDDSDDSDSDDSSSRTSDDSISLIDSDGSLDSSSAQRKAKQLVKLDLEEVKTTSFFPPGNAMLVSHPVLFIQMELCHRTLDHYLKNRMTSSLEMPIDIAFNELVADSLLSAVSFLHHKGVVHRDIKPSNVFIKCQDNHETILLGDFGLARSIQDLVLNDSPTPTSEQSSTTKLTSGLGTYLYAAPEQLTSNSYTLSADIFSSGVVIYELYNKFSTSMERANSLNKLRSRHALSNEFERQWPKLASVISSMISKSPDCRPSASELLSLFKASRSNDSEVDVLRAENAMLKEKLSFYESKIECLERRLDALARGDSEDAPSC